MASESALSEPADIGESPIITSNEDEILNVRQLKKLRSTAKGLVTRKRNEINELLSTPMPHIDELKKRAHELETVMEKFQISHGNYHQNLKDEEDIEESNEYLEAEQTRVNYLIERIVNVIEHQSSIVPHIIDPHDSASNTGKSKLLSLKQSKISHKSGSRISSSVRSTTSSAKAKAVAKKAALEVEAANYKKKMALQQEELQLQQKQEMLDLEIELQKAKAEEQAYIEIEIEKENRDSQSAHLQNVTQFSPSPKIEQTPVQGCSVYEAKNEHEASVKHQTLNPTAEEWPYTLKSGGQLKSANETSEPNQNGIALHNSHAAYLTNMQTQQNQQLERMMIEQQRYTAALSLPQPEVPVFKGQPSEYCSFIRAFENLIESKTDSSSSRLYYLVQYTAGDVQELMRSCLAMSPDEGYQEARRLMKEKYGQNYKIAAAYVDRLTNGPPIRSEDGNALQKFSVQLTSCKNALKDIGYLNKLENPDALRKVIERLPYGIRQKWREVVDDIIQRQNRDVTVEDIATFVEKRVRVATHPIFGNITNDSRNDSSKHRSRSGNGTPKGSSFGTNAESNQPSPPPGTSSVKCPSCSQNHRLFQCPDFRKKTLEERLQFVRKRGLCNNCFARGHLAKTCEMPSFCRVKGCNFKHSTFLHPKGNANEKRDDAAESPENVNPKGKNEDQPLETVVQSAYVNTGENSRSRRSQPPQVTSLAIVPVKVKAKNSSVMIETYAFLDGGSNTTFCTERLMNQLKAAGKRTTLSLTTMTQEDRPVESSIVSLELFDLREENFIDLPIVFSTAKLPVSKENMATQQDAEKWSHLNRY